MPERASDRPLVSIIIPTYNCANFLREALASVVGQTIGDWEAIVVNNYSTDHTKEVVHSFQDERIRTIDYKNEGVIAASRNVGIKDARGQYVAFLDSDDRWHPEKLERCLLALRNGQLDLVCHGEIHFDHSGPLRSVDYGKGRPVHYDRLLFAGNCFSTSALICTAELLRKEQGFDIDRSINTAEDYDLWLRFMRNQAKAAVLPEMLGEYRIHPSSASSSLSRHFHAVRRVVEVHFAELERRTARHYLLFARRWAYIVLGATRQLVRHGHLREALSFPCKALCDRHRFQRQGTLCH